MWYLAHGYRFAGIHCGIRDTGDRKDLALVFSDQPATAAGVFTQNRVVAAPVQLCRARLPMEGARGIVICSGNANACTGQRGLDDAQRMAELAAHSVGVEAERFLVASTGVIGAPLPMAVLERGIPHAAAQLEHSRERLEDAALAILTTDTRIKVSTRTLHLGGQPVTITGFAKGAAMIGPNMATLLAFVLTDASVAADDLQQIAREAGDQSFNCISVEGHTSTNDTLLLLANGQGPTLRGADLDAFGAEVRAVCADLARGIAADAEGANHLVRIDVEGLRTEPEARQVARAVANSALVKTAIFGADPNWGRIVSAAGYAGVAFAENDLTLWLGDFLLYDAGAPVPFDKQAVSAYLKNNRDIVMVLRFMLGKARCTFWTCDLTYDYVRLNADYTT